MREHMENLITDWDMFDVKTPKRKIHMEQQDQGLAILFPRLDRFLIHSKFPSSPPLHMLQYHPLCNL
jgi:hypothetical protein